MADTVEVEDGDACLIIRENGSIEALIPDRVDAHGRLGDVGSKMGLLMLVAANDALMEALETLLDSEAGDEEE